MHGIYRASAYLIILYLCCLCSCRIKYMTLYFYSGRIQKIDSLFYYAPGESYSTFARTEFQPLFLEDVLANMTDAQRTTAEQTCGDNKECIFDFAVTGEYQTTTYKYVYENVCMMYEAISEQSAFMYWRS